MTRAPHPTDSARPAPPPDETSGQDSPPRGLVAAASVVIEARPEAVWDALTDPERIPRFLFGSRVASDWRPGSPIRWTGEWQGSRYEDQGEVLRSERPRLLRMTHFSPLLGLPDVPENYHTITVRLAPVGGGTRVTLAQDNNESEEARAHSEGSWGMMLNGLKRVVEGTAAAKPGS